MDRGRRLTTCVLVLVLDGRSVNEMVCRDVIVVLGDCKMTLVNVSKIVVDGSSEKLIVDVIVSKAHDQSISHSFLAGDVSIQDQRTLTRRRRNLRDHVGESQCQSRRRRFDCEACRGFEHWKQKSHG